MPLILRLVEFATTILKIIFIASLISCNTDNPLPARAWAAIWASVLLNKLVHAADIELDHLFVTAPFSVLVHGHLGDHLVGGFAGAGQFGDGGAVFLQITSEIADVLPASDPNITDCTTNVSGKVSHENCKLWSV